MAIEARVKPEQVAVGQAVMYDNGGYYLFVDSECHYWVNDPAQIWSETRAGKLDAASALELGERLRFGAWSDVRGSWTTPPDTGVHDAPAFIFDNGTDAVVCIDLCEGDDVPDAVQDMRTAFPSIASELWQLGTSVESGVRAIASPAEPGPGIPNVDWPLSRPIDDFVVAGMVAFGEGVAEEDPTAAETLKELRASFVRGDHGAFVWNALPVTSNGQLYWLYMRDSLPFEGTDGIVPLTGSL